MNPVEVSEKSGPVILGQPHGGVFIPPELSSRLNDRGRTLADTDWHIHRLYEGLLTQATVVQANFSRYVIDANRDPSGNSLYPGQNTTGLCPIIDFEGQSIYNEERVRNQLGVVLLFDCHSIRSELPFLFEGQLPDLNLGTNNGATCATEIEQSAFDVCSAAEGYTSVLNGRFKGGWTTRHYGKPSEGIHAIQLEITQKNYMEEVAPWSFRSDLASGLRNQLKTLLTTLEEIVTGLINTSKGN